MSTKSPLFLTSTQDFSTVSSNNDIETLSKQGILLTQYYGLTHPSQPNYIASVGGDYFGLDNDDFVRLPSNVSTLIDLFDSSSPPISWRGYFEGISSPGYMGVSTTNPGGHNYVRKHNPFVSYDSVNTNGTRLANILSLDDFMRDMNSSQLPQYMHISPDMQNDGHDTSLDFAASWVQSFLNPLLSNESLMNDTLILLTYDESATYSLPNRIVSLLLGGAIPAHLKGTQDPTFYTHYSILSTLEYNWNLPCLGRYDVGANVFSFTNYSHNVNIDTARIDLSASYPGFLNSQKGMPIPPPNLQLVGAGGKGVVEVVKGIWAGMAGQQSPYDGSGNVFGGPNPPVYRAQGSNAVATGTTTGSAVAPSSTATSGAVGRTGGAVGLVLGAVVAVAVLMLW